MKKPGPKHDRDTYGAYLLAHAEIARQAATFATRHRHTDPQLLDQIVAQKAQDERVMVRSFHKNAQYSTRAAPRDAIIRDQCVLKLEKENLKTGERKDYSPAPLTKQQFQQRLSQKLLILNNLVRLAHIVLAAAAKACFYRELNEWRAGNASAFDDKLTKRLSDVINRIMTHPALTDNGRN